MNTVNGNRPSFIDIKEKVLSLMDNLQKIENSIKPCSNSYKKISFESNNSFIYEATEKINNIRNYVKE